MKAFVVDRKESDGNDPATLIFLHGLGDTGESWMYGCHPFHKAMPFIKLVCPNSPVSPVTLNYGMSMPSWHDIKDLATIDDDSVENFTGLEQSIEIVKEFIEKEIESGIPPSRIILGGFSQGACLSMSVAYGLNRIDKRLGGVIALSGYLPHHKKIDAKCVGENPPPLFQGHGEADPVVAYVCGKRAESTLKAAGVDVEFVSVPRMPHSTSDEEMKQVGEFIARVLKK